MISRRHAEDSDTRVPEDLRELDRLLSSIRFEPRASLGPEVLGRLRREEEPPEGGRRRIGLALGVGIATLVLSLAVFFLWDTVLRVTEDQIVDQCCFELDGGGPADDGVLVEAGHDEVVRRLTIYEDLDGSGSFNEGDLIRFSRGASPVLQEPLEIALTAFHHCCRDYDGGGRADDGVLVLGVPPDRVVMAGIYDTRKSGDSPAVPGPLRPALR